MEARRFSARVVVCVVAAAAVGLYYLWGVRAAGTEFTWRHDLGGYYDYLGRGFAQGQLHVPLQPAPELLALPNPWDPSIDGLFKMYDMAFYKGRYYLYHGAAPAVLLFLPWRLITGHDLPENFALFLLCFGGFLFSCGALGSLWRLAQVRPGPLLLGTIVLALGICQSVPYLLNRVYVYEIAIGGGYFCVAGALFFLLRALEGRRRKWWLAASGLMFGFAVACRPHLILAGAIAFVALVILVKPRRDLAAFLAPMAAAGIAIAAYNFARFGDPFEFGLKYLLAGPNQNRIRLAWANVLPGLYFFGWCPPDFSPVFPWVKLAFRTPFDSKQYPFPPEYFIEPTMGAIWMAPFLTGVFLVRRIRLLVIAILAMSVSILLFLAATGFTTQRYEVDFLPLAALAALAGTGVYVSTSTGWRRIVAGIALGILVTYSAMVNLALGISGPYNDMLHNKPQRFVRIAGWFSPMRQFRPVLNPELSVRLRAQFARQADHFREPLVNVGREYTLLVEHLAGKLRFISQYGTSNAAGEMEDPGEAAVEVRLTFSPETRKMTTSVNGREVLVHELGSLVAAPTEVEVGKGFTGRLLE